MILGKTIYIIDSHTAGMPTRIIVGGVPGLPGGSIAEKAAYFRDHFDYIRTALFQEPRRLLRGIGAVITAPATSKAQLGVFYMDSTHQLIPMCGHGSIGVITAAIEFGMVEDFSGLHSTHHGDVGIFPLLSCVPHHRASL